MKLTLRNTTAEHVAIDRHGYDATGRYWGVGERLFRLDAADPCQVIVNRYGYAIVHCHVRAPNAWLARAVANQSGCSLDTAE